MQTTYSIMKMLAALPLGLALLVTQPRALAQNNVQASPNQFGVNFRLGFNIDAEFKNVGGFRSRSSIGSAAGGGGATVSATSSSMDRFYDDGFVRVDSSGNNGGKTWFWGYDNPSQVQGDNLLMHSASSPANGRVEEDSDPQLGFEFTYSRRLGNCWGGTWGLASAFGFTDLSIDDNTSLSSRATLVTDAYALGGITPPLAPYAGSFSGPGPLISDAPGRSTLLGTATTTGHRELDAQIYSLRLGPYWQIPITRRFSALVSGGLALADVDSDFSFSERVKVATVGSSRRSGSNSNNDILVGLFVEAGLDYAFSEQWSAFTGLQYQYLDDFSQSAGGKEVNLDLSKSIYYVLGVRWRF